MSAEPSNNQPLVSIGIPTYNRPAGLRHTLECVTKQTYRNLEIVVSNNASPDDETDAIIRSYAANDDRIKYYKQDTNIGVFRNFEFVLTKATGKYFVWFADDDSCEPEFIGETVACLERDDDVALAMCEIRFVDEMSGAESTMRLSSISVARATRDWAADRRLFFDISTEPVFMCIYGVYRTSVLKDCERLDFTSPWKKIVAGSEIPFLSQIAVRGKIVSVPGVLKTYRSHAGSAYIRERSRLRGLDHIIRNTELRILVTLTALRSGLALKDRVTLALTPWPSSFVGAKKVVRHKLGSLINFALGSSANR
jgi:glycosyltransferase involved in cell wall biosynthesis